MNPAPHPAGAVPAVLLLSVAVGVTVARDVQYLFASPYPYGVDGYYYLSLLTRGAPAGGGAPLPIGLLHLAAVPAGPVAAIKICGLLFLLCGGAAAAFLGARLGSSPAAGALAFVLYTQGFMRVELLVNFLKQSMGQIWLLLLLILLAGLTPLGRRARAGCIVAAMAGALLSHPLAGVLGGLMLGGACLFALLGRRYRTGVSAALASLGSAAALLALSGLAARLARSPDSIWPAARLFLQERPGLNLDLLHESLSSTPAFPRAALLCGLALASLAVLALARGRLSRGQGIALSAAAPIAVMALNPFLVPWTENPMGLHLRIIAALGLVLAVLVPVAIACLPRRGPSSSLLAAALALLFLVPPPHWAGHAGPPPDGGRLHEGMVRSAPRIPEHAVVLTDLPRGNMVRALWGRPWKELRAAALERAQPDHYRLQYLSGDEHVSLGSPVPGSPALPVIEIVAPWYLVSEEAWRAHTGE